MFGVMPIGPYRQLPAPDGSSFPWYIIPFDKNGYCTGPETRKALTDDIKAGSYSDIFVFSHGWNNDWEAATSLYRRFIDGYMEMHAGLKAPPPDGYKPLLIGLFWPSIILTTDDDEVQFASDELVDRAVAQEHASLAELAAEVRGDPARFYALAQKKELTEQEALELISLVDLPHYFVDDIPGLEEFPASAMIENAPQETPEDLEKIGASSGAEVSVEAAGWLDPVKMFLPRTLLRLLTVRQMKDRAGLVGVRGGAPLLQDLLSAKPGKAPRIHLIGHSYGCRLLLSSVCGPEELRGRIASMLLLQPAVSHLCFSKEIAITGKPGGYRKALSRVAAPIVCTYSERDHPLHDFFHLALFRKGDLAEAEIAGELIAVAPPSIYAALGGYGPRECDQELLTVRLPGSRYPLGDGHPVLGIDGTSTISGHGDVANLTTWWALYNLVSWSWGPSWGS